MTGDLEARYRSVLRSYPRSWLIRNEEAIIGTLLDSADRDGRVVPAVHEIQNLRLAGLAARVNTHFPPRARVLASRISFASGFGFSLMFFLFQSWTPWASSLLNGHFRVQAGTSFASPGYLIPVLWALAVVAALVGKTAVVRSALVLVVLTSIALFCVDHFSLPYWRGPSAALLVFFAGFAVIAIISPPAQSRRSLLAGLGAAVVTWSAIYTYVGAPQAIAGQRAVADPAVLVVLTDIAGFVVALLPIVASALALAGRSVEARIVVVSALPWVLGAWFAVFGLSRSVGLRQVALALILPIVSFVATAMLVWAIDRLRIRQTPATRTPQSHVAS